MGNRIAELRKKKGMSQTELGKRIGATQRQISYWENGHIDLLDADVHETSVHVSRSKTRAGTGRLLPLNARLTALCALWRSLKKRMGVESPYFVCHWDGSPITPRMMYDWWRKRRMRLCGADWNLHEFRHTLATNMGAAGVSAVVLMQVMGWSSPAMASVYCHEERDAISAAFGRLSDGR